MSKRQKSLIENTVGSLVGISWLREFKSLSKGEAEILLLMLQDKNTFKDSAVSNAEIALKLRVSENHVSARTKALFDKDFLSFFELKIDSSIRPVKKYYIPSDMAKCYSDPAFLRPSSVKETKGRKQSKQIEPTIDEATLRRLDPDSKVGLS